MRQWHSERGLMYAHYQIFFDFVHIDHEVMENSLRDPKGYYNSSDPHEIKTNRYFYEYYNGSYYRDGQLLSENDILVVFEDDAIVIKRNISFLLRREFENFNKELVRLGWCQSDEGLCDHFTQSPFNIFILNHFNNQSHYAPMHTPLQGLV